MLVQSTPPWEVVNLAISDWFSLLSSNLEQTLRQQLFKAIDDAYLTALRNCQTNTIDVSIPVIIDYLFSNHGRVTPAMLQHEEKLVKEMFYDPTHPIDVISNKVEDLSDLSAAARADFTEAQLINIAYVIINSTGKYQPYIREWSRLPQEQEHGHILRHTSDKPTKSSRKQAIFKSGTLNSIQQI